MFPELDTVELGPECTGLSKKLVKFVLSWYSQLGDPPDYLTLFRGKQFRNLIISVKGWDPATVSRTINKLKEMYPHVNVTIKRVE